MFSSTDADTLGRGAPRSVLPRVKVQCAVAGGGWGGRAGRAAWRSHWGGCRTERLVSRAERRVSRGEAGSQGAGGGHGCHCCAAETGHGLRQLVRHLAERQIQVSETGGLSCTNDSLG